MSFSPSRIVVGLSFLATSLLSWGCRDKPQPDKSAEPAAATKRVRPSLYEAVQLSPKQLAVELKSHCEVALANSQPVLVEFSAPWCKDCLRLQAMKKEPVLEQAMKKTQFVTINVGDFDRHEQLVAAFDIRAIARWQLLSPSDCSQPVGMWKRLAGRTLEPETGAAVNAEQLAQWVDKNAG